jgi:hypothetical protein
MALDVQGTDYLKLPVGTTAQRPAAPATGMTRQNSTTGLPEWYDTVSSSWIAFNQPTPTGAPAFSAYLTSNQTVTTSTWTKLAIATEDFDTNNNFDSVTNYRFTPTVAGYYQVNGIWQLSSGTTFTRAIIAIYKNGALVKQGLDNTTSTATGSIISSLISMNGSTDYIELYAFIVGTGTLIIASGVGTYFNAAMVRNA